MKFVTVGASLALSALLVMPARAGMTSRDYHDSLIVGRGFNAVTGEGLGWSPFVSTVLVPVEQGATTTFQLLEGNQTEMTERGLTISGSIEAKLFASGKISASESTSQKQESVSVRIRIISTIDSGRQLLRSYALTPEAKAVQAQGWAAWIKRAGTDAVIGIRPRSVLIATFSVNRLSLSAQQQLGLSYSASVGGLTASLSTSGNYTEFLKKLSTYSNVGVNIATTAPASAPLADIIRTPGDVDRVLTAFSNLSASLATSPPTAGAFITVPWSEIIAFPGGTGDASIDRSDANYEILYQEATKARALRARLLEVIEGQTGYYSYLGTSLLTPYTQGLTLVNQRLQQIYTTAANFLRTGRSTPTYWPPIIVDWAPAPVAVWQSYRLDRSGVYGVVRVQGGSRFATASLVNSMTGETYSLLQSARSDTASWTEFTLNLNTSWVAGNWRDRYGNTPLVIRFQNPKGDLIFQVPLPPPT